MRRQGRLRSTLRPNRHSSITGASSIILPSYSSTAGSKIQLGVVSQSSAFAPPLAQGVSALRKRPLGVQASRAPRLPIPFRLAIQGAAAAVATGSVGCGRGASGEAATAAEGPRREGQHCAPSPLSQPLMGAHLSCHCRLPHAPRCRHRHSTSRSSGQLLSTYLYRNTASSLCITSSACSESPWSFSTRTRKPRQQ